MVIVLDHRMMLDFIVSYYINLVSDITKSHFHKHTKFIYLIVRAM